MEEVFKEISQLQINNSIDWWDLFVMVVQTVTTQHCKEMARIKRMLKNSIEKQINCLEANDGDELIWAQKEDYAYLKCKKSRTSSKKKSEDTKSGRKDGAKTLSEKYDNPFARRERQVTHRK